MLAPVQNCNLWEVSRASQMRQSSLPRPFPQTESRKTLSGRNGASGRVRVETGIQEGPAASPDRVLLAVRPVCVCADSFVRKGSRDSNGSPATSCQEKARCGGACGRSADPRRGPRRTDRLGRDVRAMENPRTHECTICGEERSTGQVWFLVAESHWEDKLKVLEWQDELARREGSMPPVAQDMLRNWLCTG